MPQLDDYHKKRLVLWASVGGTTAIIVALWAFVLPHQLAKFKADSSGDASLSRWISERKADGQDSSQSFVELLQRQRERLNAVARNQLEAGNTNASNAINIEELRAKINSGLNANASTGSPDTKVNAPATP